MTVTPKKITLDGLRTIYLIVTAGLMDLGGAGMAFDSTPQQ